MEKNIIENYLKQCALNKYPANYIDLLQRLGWSNSNNEYRRLFKLLIRIGNECENNGKPLLNVLVCNSKGIPGPGFYDWFAKKFEQNFNYESETIQKKLFRQLSKECFNFYSKQSFSLS